MTSQLIDVLPSTNGASRATRFAIIGAGPRGTYALAALARRLASLQSPRAVEIFVIDPYLKTGGETYNTAQPAYFLMNTVAEQITAKPDHSLLASTDITGADNMAEWFRSNISEAVRPNAYLPRRFHGEYLMQARYAAAAILPKSAKVRFMQVEVTGIDKQRDNFVLRLSDGTDVNQVSSVVVTTGRGTPENLLHVDDSPDTIENPYPIERWIVDISSSDTIGVQGLGLTAIDVILALTIGRGGAFEERHGRVKYIPSGQEPMIVAWSRSGIPLLARAVNQKGSDARHIPQFLTHERIKELRRQSVAVGREGKLDFHAEILPLVSQEIALAACLSYFYKKLPSENTDGNEILGRLFHLLPSGLQLDWGRLRESAQVTGDTHAEYVAHMREFLQSDLRAASEGNVGNVHKCAADCLRDIRDQIRAAVDWCGLTPESMERFENEFVPPYLRLAVGPPPIRIKQLLALWDAGILDLGLGPNPELTRTERGKHIIKSRLSGGQTFALDKIIKARITSVPGGHMAKALLQSGLCRFAENRLGGCSKKMSALDVDVNNRAIDPNGLPVAGLFIFGALCEGVNWYTYAAARPFVGSRVLSDAEKWAENEISRLLSGLQTSGPRPEEESYDYSHSTTGEAA